MIDYFVSNTAHTATDLSIYEGFHNHDKYEVTLAKSERIQYFLFWWLN